MLLWDAAFSIGEQPYLRGMNGRMKALIHLLNGLVLLSGMGLFIDRMDCSRTGSAYVAVNSNLSDCKDNCGLSTESLTDDCCNRKVNFYKEVVLRNGDSAPCAFWADIISIIPATFKISVAMRHGAIGTVWAKTPPLPYSLQILFCSFLI